MRCFSPAHDSGFFGTKQVFDDVEGMFHLGPHARLDDFERFTQPAQLRICQGTTSRAFHRPVLVDWCTKIVLALVHSRVAGAAQHAGPGAMQ